METRVKIVVPPEWVERATEWGRKSVKGYNEGKKENSRQYARPGIAESIPAQSMGKLGEIAFCLWCGFDPEILDWGARPDRGFDVVMGQARIDVKATNTDCLIWPVTKRFLGQAPVDIFVLAESCERPTIYLSGWIGKGRFLREHKKAEIGNPGWCRRASDVGTQYMDRAQLNPMAWLWH